MVEILEKGESGSENLLQQRSKLTAEIALVSSDLKQARSVVLSETNAFVRAQTLTLRLAELGKERDALTMRIEQGKSSPG